MVQTEKQLKVGQRVSVQWTKKQYRGKIIKVNSRRTKFRVAYDDGDMEWEKAETITVLSDQEEEPTNKRRKRKTARYVSHEEDVSIERKKRMKTAAKRQTVQASKPAPKYTLAEQLAFIPKVLRKKASDNAKKNLDSENADQVLFSTQQLITQMMFNRKVRDVTKLKLSTTDDATTQMALVTLEAVLSDFGQTIPVSVVDQIFRSLSLGSAKDVVQACALWENESKKPKSPGSEDSDDDTDNDTETEEVGYTPARLYKTPKHKRSSGKKAKGKSGEEGMIAGSVLRMTPDVAGLILRLLTTLGQGIPQMKMPVHSFEQIEEACQAVLTLQACVVFSGYTLSSHHKLKFSNWFYCTNLVLDAITRSLQVTQETGKYTSGVLNILARTNEPQPISLSVERLLTYVTSSYRLVHQANKGEQELIRPSLDKLRWLLRAVASGLGEEIESSGKYSATEKERSKMLLSFLSQPPMSGTLSRDLGLPFSIKKLEDYGAVFNKSELLKTKLSTTKRGKMPIMYKFFEPLPSFLGTNRLSDALESTVVLVLAIADAKKVEIPSIVTEKETVKVPAAAPVEKTTPAAEDVIEIDEKESVDVEIIEPAESESFSNSVGDDDILSSADGRTTMFGDNSSRDASDAQSILVKHKVIARPRSLSGGKMWDSPFKQKLASVKFLLRRLSSIPCSRKCPQLIRLMDAAEVTLGRASVCDYRLLSKDKSQTQTISRKHAKLFVTHREGKGLVCQILDNNSSNGVFVNYVRIEPGKRFDLKPEDIIIFGGGGKTAVGSHKRFKSEFRYCLELPIPV